MSTSSKNPLLAILVVGILGVGTLAWWQSRRIAELEDRIARAETENAAARQRATVAETRLATSEKARAELDEQRNESRRAATAERARATPAAATARALNTGPLENPAVQRMLANGMRGSLDQRYGTLFRQLKLSPAELEKFKDLLTERQMSALDAMTAGRTQGVTAAELPALMEKVQSDVDQGIRQLLGDSRFERYQSFNQNITSYNTLDQIERRLSYTNAPLDTTQSEALLRVLIETAPSAPANDTAAMRGNALGIVQALGGSSIAASLAGPGPAITNQTIERASGVLSPPQVEALRQLQAEQQSQMTAVQGIRVMNAVSGGGGGAAEAAAGAATATSQPAPATAPRR